MNALRTTQAHSDSCRPYARQYATRQASWNAEYRKMLLVHEGRVLHGFVR